jgi:hypothetical protein
MQDTPQVTVGQLGNGGEPDSAASQKNWYINYNKGIVDPSPRVFLIFWGSWWINNGSAEQSTLTKFFEGVGGRGDNWSTIADQYYYTCYTKLMPRTCYTDLGSGPVLIGGSADTGTIVDPTDPPSNRPTETQLAKEAANTWQVSIAATTEYGPDVIPIVVLPKGVISKHDVDHIDCAHHNWDYWYSQEVSMYQPFAWAEVSYDEASLGGGFFGGPTCNFGTGTSGGLTISAGHEFLESVTDPYPPTGTPQTDPSGQYWGLDPGWINGNKGNPPGEIGDYCTGKVFSLKLSTGKFSVQKIWSNAIHGCAKST